MLVYSFFVEAVRQMGGRVKMIKLNELDISHLKGSGPGGQNRNKRMSGVRIKHIPSGIVVVATERRSQKQNLEAALTRLEIKLKKLYERPIPRKKTAPSKASCRERLFNKRTQSTRKKLRSKKSHEWD